MGIILLAKILNEDKETIYRVLDSSTHTVCTATKKEIIASNQKFINFRVTKSHKIITKGERLKLTIIINDEVIEEHNTLIKIDKTGENITIADYNGIIQTISQEDYLKLRELSDINNEYIFTRGEEYCILVKSYCEDEEGQNVKIPVKRKELKKTESHEDTSFDTENTSNINEEVQIEDVGESQEETLDTFNVKEKKESREENTTNIEEDTNNKNRLTYKKLVFNMYPMDKITLSYEDFEVFRYVILKILDSNMSDTKRLTFCKLYKTEDKTRCTFALIEFNDEKSLCAIQVVGQSDIPEKAMKDDVQAFCMTYTSWLKESKYIKI